MGHLKTNYLTDIANPSLKANYLLWRVAASSMKYLTEEARKISLRFSEKLTGKTEETER